METTPTPKAPIASSSLFYTTNGGLQWNLIDTLPGNPGAYVWNVPAVPATKLKSRVKVVLKDALGNKVGIDVSDSFFSIQPSP
jgi:hypothetical protein